MASPGHFLVEVNGYRFGSDPSAVKNFFRGPQVTIACRQLT
jgi:uncharacterized Fe-S cluster-containing radical SAM superfamily protein